MSEKSYVILAVEMPYDISEALAQGHKLIEKIKNNYYREGCDIILLNTIPAPTNDK